MKAQLHTHTVSIVPVSDQAMDDLIGNVAAVAELPLVHHIHQPVLCPYELSSVRAMAAFVAQKNGVSAESVEAVVEAEFGVENLAQLRAQDFRHVIAYLSDLRLDDTRR